MGQAVLDHYRSRSAYKIIELDDKFHFLRPGSVVVRLSEIVHGAITAALVFQYNALGSLG